MSLMVRCTITIENQVYESFVTPGLALKEVGGSSVAPGNFASLDRALLEGLVESAIDTARANVKNKLDVLKGER